MTDLRPIEIVCLRVETILVISESSLATNSDVSLLSKKFYSQNKNKRVNKMKRRKRRNREEEGATKE